MTAREVVTECMCGQLPALEPADDAGPLTCERCGARVHNLSADGQCITCIAGGAESCERCGAPTRGGNDLCNACIDGQHVSAAPR